MLSNGNSPANLANSSTRAELAVFGECEYSPKRPFSEMCRTRQTRRHSPSRVARTRQTRRHSPSRVARTRQTRRHSPSRVARTRQTRERRVWHVLCEFSESGESGEFGECRLDRFIHIKYVIWAKNDLSYHARLRRAVSRGLARLANIRRDVSHGLARLADIRRAVSRGLARLADTRRAVLRGLARLANTRFGEFLRKMWLASTHSRVTRASLANLARVAIA
jgi:hypothetical protein